MGRTAAWYCPWVAAGAIRDAGIGLVSEPPSEAVVTLPSPIPGQAADVLPVTLGAGDAVGIEIAAIVRRGDSPAIVEFDDGPAGVGFVMWGDGLLTADRCVGSAPKSWHLPGGTTATGFTTELRLFNPFAELARVDVQALSEFGAEALPEFEGVAVAPGSWETLDLGIPLPLRDVLSVSVEARNGLVIPSLVVTGGGDEASWPGSGVDRLWEFPVSTVGGLEGFLTVSNPHETPTRVLVDVYGPEGAFEEAAAVDVEPLTSTRLVLAELGTGPMGVRVRADQTVGATVEARPPVPAEDTTPDPGEPGSPEEAPAPRGLAGTVGVRPSDRWLVPATGALEDAGVTIWILNASPTSVTVTVDPLGPGDPPPDKVVVEAGTVLGIAAIVDEDVEGYVVAASGPVSVAVSFVDERGVAFAAGIPVR
ncbi:MAG TPA: hypothetical protein ENK55_11390 [Actinobacteria bacterium]|nr:hypothetical protein [Actinomycetota bacterium]